jgi:chorismate synthase
VALERASARETTMRVAVGAICRAYLAQFGIAVGGYVTSIGEVEADLADDLPYAARFAAAEENDVRCPDPAAVERMRATIWDTMQAKDTLGGVFEVVALGVPPGLGSHVHFDRKLDARLAAAMLSIQAMKGVEIGPAFENARRRGTQVHDEITLDEDGSLRRKTNRAGGLEGGVTTGEPIVLRVAMKPISTTLTPLMSVDLATGQPAPTKYERSDFSAVPRAVVIGEAMAAWVLADALMEKLGGDSLEEQLPRFAALRRSRVEDAPMDGAAWRFGYER